MNTKMIITIGRQFGSGGKDVGEKLAEDFGIKFYDRELLTRAAEESGYSEEIFETNDEKPTSSFLYSIAIGSYSPKGFNAATVDEVPINEKVFLAQFETIKKIADEGPCVIVGRCADYALESYENVVTVYIHASLEDRIRRVARKEDITDNKAKDLIQKTDKSRASYYNYYTDNKWNDAATYDLCLDSGKLGIDGTVKAIEDYVALRESMKDKPQI